MRPLLLDIGRCSGFTSLADERVWCDHKDTCARFLSFVDWDSGIIDNHKGVSVTMAVENCQRKIEVGEV